MTDSGDKLSHNAPRRQRPRRQQACSIAFGGRRANSWLLGYNSTTCRTRPGGSKLLRHATRRTKRRRGKTERERRRRRPNSPDQGYLDATRGMGEAGPNARIDVACRVDQMSDLVCLAGEPSNGRQQQFTAVFDLTVVMPYRRSGRKTTAHLFLSPKNARRLFEALLRSHRGSGKRMTIDQIRALVVVDRV